MTEQKKINLAVSDGPDFFANEVSVNFSPLQFVFDFKCITPRVDMRTKSGPVLSIKHNVVLLDPYHAKNFHKMLGDLIKKYEENYVKIKKPDALAKAEKKSKEMHNIEEVKQPIPNYLG